MGEYAMFQGSEIKIGTCENMYYLRASQARLVRALEGNVDPVADRHEIRFRFPFPDEDTVKPGEFESYERALVVAGVPCKTGEIDHAKGCEGGDVTIIQQRWVGATLVLVCGCSGCDARYRVPSFEDADQIIKGCERLAKNNPEFWLAVAIRVAAGYLGRTEKDMCDAHEDCQTNAKLSAACKAATPTRKPRAKRAPKTTATTTNAQLDYADFLGIE